MQSVKAYISNFSVQTSQEIYEQFIKDIELVQKIYPEYDEETKERIRRSMETRYNAEQLNAHGG